MINLPMFQNDSTDFQYSIDLDNVSVQLRFTYNVRSGYFRMNIATENYSLYGLKMVPDYPLLDNHKALFPELLGDIIITQVNRLDEQIDCTFDNLGTDFKVYYYNADELASWKANNGI